jgi:tetratricopeptide (TPR) repeat protein
MQTRRLLRPKLALCFTALVFAATSLFSQGRGLDLPPSGENQKAAVIQHIGPVEVRIDYSSPDVTGPQGQDRRGQVWGQLVPYGLTNLGFGTTPAGPWRAGANENTVFTVSHDVMVQGEKLAAGRYGLHMIAAEDGNWTVIFSHNSTSWGSFFYDPEEDALRVPTRAEKAPFREWLTYDFVDRQPSEATLALHWEELRVPFTISVPNRTELYLTGIRNDLRDSPGFTWQNWNTAAQFALGLNVALEEALEWAEASISAPFVGQANFTTLSTKAQVLTALGRNAEAREAWNVALNDPTAGPIQLHGYARQQQIAGDMAEAIRVYKLNHERFGEVWPVHVGLARAYSAEGDFEKALQHAKAAREQAPDPLNQGNLDTIIGILEQGRDFNTTN